VQTDGLFDAHILVKQKRIFSGPIFYTSTQCLRASGGSGGFRRFKFGTRRFAAGRYFPWIYRLVISQY
jgi:hypothetical protein